MSHPTTKFDRLRRFIAVSLLFLAAISTSEETATASCGDYLLHGPASASATHRPMDVPGGRLVETGKDLPAPATTPSPCDGGRCQQAPAPEPVSVPSRVVVWKQIAFETGDVDSSRNDQSSIWARLSNERLLPLPFLAVEIHPPIAA